MASTTSATKAQGNTAADGERVDVDPRYPGELVAPKAGPLQMGASWQFWVDGKWRDGQVNGTRRDRQRGLIADVTLTATDDFPGRNIEVVAGQRVRLEPLTATSKSLRALWSFRW